MEIWLGESLRTFTIDSSHEPSDPGDAWTPPSGGALVVDMIYIHYGNRKRRIYFYEMNHVYQEKILSRLEKMHAEN